MSGRHPCTSDPCRLTWVASQVCLAMVTPQRGCSTAVLSAGLALSSSSGLGPSPRDAAVEKLSSEIFAKGNAHWKNVETLTALPEGLHSYPEVCFIGKPNAGKSTLISCLLRNPRLGRGGKIPGTTRLLQFFNVGDAILLVDTPGYGGWKGRRLDLLPRVRANAFAILFRYLALRKQANLKRVYWLMEASASGPVSIQPRDEEILGFLIREGIPFSVVLTKIDRHDRFYLEQHRATMVVGKDGVPREGNYSDMLSTGRYTPIPSEGVERNMKEICEFVGSDEVPIIPVSANRKQPTRCRNLEALQHDITHYCAQELKTLESLTYAQMRELSYAPPRPEDIQQVQRQYPVECFVVPQSNLESLEEMVTRHEDAKAEYLANSARFHLFTPKDAEGQNLLDSRLVAEEEAIHEEHRALMEKVPPSTTLGQLPALTRTTSVPSGMQLPLHTTLRTPPQKRPDPEMKKIGEGDGDDVTGVSVTKEPVQSPAAPMPYAQTEATYTQPQFSAGATAVATASLPISLDPLAQYVTAINGVRIPRSLIPSSVEQLAVKKEDELPAFALRSGAGAYEELLMTDHTLSQTHHIPEMFMEHPPTAGLSEGERDALLQVHSRSARRKQEERLLAKYVELKRQERSIYLHAEGYMCPWLAGAGQSRSAVQGVATFPGSCGRSGALMKNLKHTGFGGRSVSARTMRNKGRSTKKTGRWAT